MKNYSDYKNRKVVITVDKNVTLARIFDDDNQVVAKGVAKCNPEDTFDFKMGAELAMKRAFENVTKEKKWKVVNREPKAGDYVRIVKSNYSFDKPGLIFRVDAVNFNCVQVYRKNHPTAETNHRNVDPMFVWNYYIPNEVEVVEPVEEYRKITRDPRPGDYIRLTKSSYNFDDVGDVLKIHDIPNPFTVIVLISDHPKCKKSIDKEYNGKWFTDVWYYSPIFDEFEFVEKVD